MKHFLTGLELTPDSFSQLLNRAIEMKTKKRGYDEVLKGKVLGLIFYKKSTRTRVSFESGIARLGGTSLYLNVNDLQLGRGEPIKDAARALSGFLDAIVIRTFKQEDLDELAKYGSISVVNALTDLYHPCQALADYMTVREIFGVKNGLKVTYMGDGNNVAHSLIIGAALAGHHFYCLSPKAYSPNAQIVREAEKIAKQTGATITVTDDFDKALGKAQVVYTDVWVSMGQEEENAKRQRDFKGYMVDQQLMGKAQKDAIFLHCLPAHRGEEVSEEVLEGKASKVWQQAENRMWTQMALLEKLLGR
jgi:ornithine carbamoyltransferase